VRFPLNLKKPAAWIIVAVFCLVWTVGVSLKKEFRAFRTPFNGAVTISAAQKPVLFFSIVSSVTVLGISALVRAAVLSRRSPSRVEEPIQLPGTTPGK